MIARPFSVHHIQTTNLYGLQMQVRFNKLELIGEVLARLDELLQAVASFANLGGISSKESFNFLITGRKLQHDTCYWEFSISNVDVSILMILVNLVHCTELEFNCIEEVVLQSSFPGTESDILRSPYLPKITYPFPIENITEGKRVTVRGRRVKSKYIILKEQYSNHVAPIINKYWMRTSRAFSITLIMTGY
jgi:hypothetical protein